MKNTIYIKGVSLIFDGLLKPAYSTDECNDNRVTLIYKDGSKHVFKKVAHIQQSRKDGTFKVHGKRTITNVYDGDIVEKGTLDYIVDIPRHHVSHYIVHSNDGFGKTERKVKVL